MKKFIYVCFFIVFISLCFSSAESKAQNDKDTNWKALNKYIYIDINSITKHKFSTSAWFKVYAPDYIQLYYIDNIPVQYELIKYDISCDPDVVALMHIKSFDKNGNLIKDVPNTYNVFSDSTGVQNGDIYYNAICKK